MRHLSMCSVLVLAACASDPAALEPRPVELTLTSPAYGAFLQDGPVVVQGFVSEATAQVWIEGQPVAVDHAGRFETTLDFQGDYEVVDVRAGGDGLLPAHQRVPVFAGNDPMDTFPGALPGRLTNDGLARIGRELGRTLDATGWDAQLLAAIPSVQTGALDLIPTGVAHEPTVVVLKGAKEGLDVGVLIEDLTILADARFTVFGRELNVPLAIGYETVSLTARAIPFVRETDGVVVLTLRDPELTLSDPVIDAGGVPLPGFLLDAIAFILEPVTGFLGDALVAGLGDIELGGPFAFEQDALGTSLAIELKEVWGDPEGLALALGVGLDEPVSTDPITVPPPRASTRVEEEVHLVLGVHEGLLDGLVGGGITDMLDQDLDLGPLSLVVGNLITSLPGGETAPGAQAWCVALEPGPAKVVRLQEGIAPWGHLYLPDVTVDFGIDNGAGCESWLVANLAMEAALVVQGSKVSIDLGVGEGAVMYYGAPATAWREADVMAGLSDLVGTLAGFLGGQLSFDLADIVGGLGSDPTLGGLGDLDVRVLDSQQMRGNEGVELDGLYAVSISLWGPE